jgi:two-component system NtrC family sensor kinase
VAKQKQPVRKLSTIPDSFGSLWLLADLAEELVSLDDLESIQEEVLGRALQMFRCHSGAFCPLDGKSGRVRIGPASGNVQGLKPEEILEAKPVREVVLDKRRPLLVADPATVLGSVPAGWRGMAVIPIRGADSLLAILVIGDLAEGQAFTGSDAALMAVLGGMTAAAIETHVAMLEFRRQVGLRMTDMVAQLNHTAAELERVRTFADDFFESVPFGIILFDREFCVTFHNRAADRLWPEDRSVLLAARRTGIAHSDPDWESDLRDVLNMQQPWLAEAVAVEQPDSSGRRGGKPGQDAIRVNLWCAPLVSGENNLVGGVLIVEDVSQRVQMERRLAVSERLAGVGRLAAMVAHEINNPLDGILRLVNLARRAGTEAGDPRVEQYLADAHKGLMRLVMIVRDLLDFARSASGAVDPMPLRETLSEVARNMAPAAEKAGVRIGIDCDAHLPPLRSATLYHVLVNLIKNAIEAMPSGGRVEVRARSLPDAVVLSVADTGPGIPPEVLPRLFEPFFSLKATGKGTGLGLVICKDLIEKQGGTVAAANRPEGGAVFTVTIPVARSREHRE